MQIIGMRNVDWNNKVKAVLTIKTSEGFEMKNFKLVEGDNGFFVGSPSVKGKDDQYHDTIWIPKELRDEINKLASETYDSSMEPNKNYPQFSNKEVVKDLEVPF